MATTNPIAQIHEGMEVHTADDAKLGKIARVWIGTDPSGGSTRCDEDVCSRLEVHTREGTLFIPSNAIARVAGKWVTLTVDAAGIHEHDWFRRPDWIEADNDWSPLGRTDPLRT